MVVSGEVYTVGRKWNGVQEWELEWEGGCELEGLEFRPAIESRISCNTKHVLKMWNLYVSEQKYINKLATVKTLHCF